MNDTTTLPTELNGIEIVAFPDADAWDAWLAANWERQEGVWIRMAKKASGIPTVTHPEAIDVALCWGWIDGQRKGLDATWFLQKFTPRRKRSLWSRVNVDKVAALTAAGRMRPPGLAEVDAAKADGRWDAAYASQSAAEVPADLEAALASRPAARAFFGTLTGANRYAVLWRLMTAKTEKTRAARLEKIVAMLEAGETFH
jgi:uncharacterized protein YdeI (YjbR/CyaY-like superfamily)